MQFQSNREAQASEAPLPTGRLLTYNDITPALKGRQAEVPPQHAVASFYTPGPLRCIDTRQLCIHTVKPMKVCA